MSKKNKPINKVTKKKKEAPRINVTFSDEDYAEFLLMSQKTGRAMADIVREYALEGKAGTLGVENLNLITQIIREQLKVILYPEVERICALSAKTCIASAQGMYLGTETISRLLPPELRMDYQKAYTESRKKAVKYTKTKLQTDVEE